MILHDWYNIRVYNNDKRRWGNDPRNEKSYYYRYGTNDTGGLGIIETYWTDKGENKKQLWARARCGNIWREHEGRGGHPCRGVKWRKKKQNTENCEEFGRVLGMDVQDRWMGLRGQIDDILLEKIKRIDEGPQKDWRNGSKTGNQKPIRVTVKKLFFIHFFDWFCIVDLIYPVSFILNKIISKKKKRKIPKRSHRYIIRIILKASPDRIKSPRRLDHSADHSWEILIWRQVWLLNSLKKKKQFCIFLFTYVWNAKKCHIQAFFSLSVCLDSDNYLWNSLKAVSAKLIIYSSEIANKIITNALDYRRKQLLTTLSLLERQ